LIKSQLPADNITVKSLIIAIMLREIAVVYCMFYGVWNGIY